VTEPVEGAESLALRISQFVQAIGKDSAFAVSIQPIAALIEADRAAAREECLRRVPGIVVAVIDERLRDHWDQRLHAKHGSKAWNREDAKYNELSTVRALLLSELTALESKMAESKSVVELLEEALLLTGMPGAGVVSAGKRDLVRQAIDLYRSEAESRRDLEADRDEWRTQHENALACWRREQEILGAIAERFPDREEGQTLLECVTDLEAMYDDMRTACVRAEGEARGLKSEVAARDSELQRAGEKIARLLHAGSGLANIVYNTRQTGHVMRDRDREVMKESVELWDEARKP
jgi:hypothetical protein